MTDERPRGARPGIGFWLVIAAAAIVNTWNMVSRPGFELGDLALPVALALAVAAIIVSLKVFLPEAVADPVRNLWLVIGLSVMTIGVALVVGSADG